MASAIAEHEAKIISETERTSALALAAMQPCSRRTVRHGRKKDGVGAVGMEEKCLLSEAYVTKRLSVFAGGCMLPDRLPPGSLYESNQFTVHKDH